MASHLQICGITPRGIYRIYLHEISGKTHLKAQPGRGRFGAHYIEYNCSNPIPPMASFSITMLAQLEGMGFEQLYSIYASIMGVFGLELNEKLER